MEVVTTFVFVALAVLFWPGRCRRVTSRASPRCSAAASGLPGRAGVGDRQHTGRLAAGVYLAGGLVDSFKGKGWSPTRSSGRPPSCSPSASATGTVLLATFLGLPVSTTRHDGRPGRREAWSRRPGRSPSRKLAGSFVLPLLCSPVVSMALTVGLYRCSAGSATPLASAGAPASVSVPPTRRWPPTLPGQHAGEGGSHGGGHVVVCGQLTRGVVGLEAGDWRPATCTSPALAVGARALNCYAKIVALMIAAERLAGPGPGPGGAGHGRRRADPLAKIAETVSKEDHPNDAGAGADGEPGHVAAGRLRQRFALPVSTTHVSVGAACSASAS